jgi:hypothetical protein
MLEFEDSTFKYSIPGDPGNEVPECSLSTRPFRTSKFKEQAKEAALKVTDEWAHALKVDAKDLIRNGCLTPRGHLISWALPELDPELVAEWATVFDALLYWDGMCNDLRANWSCLIKVRYCRCAPSRNGKQNSSITQSIIPGLSAQQHQAIIEDLVLGCLFQSKMNKPAEFEFDINRMLVQAISRLSVLNEFRDMLPHLVQIARNAAKVQSVKTIDMDFESYRDLRIKSSGST